MAADGTWYVHSADALGFQPAWVPSGCIGAVRPSERSAADATLIAAAPLLAEVLREYVGELDRPGIPSQEWSDANLAKMYAALRAAGVLASNASGGAAAHQSQISVAGSDGEKERGGG